MGHCHAGCVTSVVAFTFGILPALLLEIVVEECVRAYLRGHGIYAPRLDGLVRELIVFPLALAIGLGTIYGIDLLDQKRDAARRRRREAQSQAIRGNATIPDAIQRAFEEYLAALAVARTTPDWKEDNLSENLQTQEGWLALHLKAFPESERLAFLVGGLLPHNPVGALRVARLCLSEDTFRTFMEEGFTYIGEAQLRYWLQQGQRMMDTSALYTCVSERLPSPELKANAWSHYDALTRPRLVIREEERICAIKG